MPRQRSRPCLSSPARVLLNDLLLLLLVGGGGLLVVLAVNYSAAGNSRPAPLPTNKWAARLTPPLAMDGLSLVIQVKGKENLRLHADRMRLQHKKWGFFRIALLQELVIENATIVLHRGEAIGGDGNSPGQAHAGQAGEGEQPAMVSGNEGLANLLETLPVGRLSGLALWPLRLEIVDEGGRDSRITARSATIDAGKGALSLTGGVSVLSGGRLLRAPKLDLDVKKGEITGPGACLLRDGAGSRRLLPCRTDIYLQSGS